MLAVGDTTIRVLKETSHCDGYPIPLRRSLTQLVTGLRVRGEQVEGDVDDEASCPPTRLRQPTARRMVRTSTPYRREAAGVPGRKDE